MTRHLLALVSKTQKEGSSEPEVRSEAVLIIYQHQMDQIKDLKLNVDGGVVDGHAHSRAQQDCRALTIHRTASCDTCLEDTASTDHIACFHKGGRFIADHQSGFSHST